MEERIYSFIKKIVFKRLGLAMTGIKGWLASLGFNWVYDNLLTPIYTFIETEVKMFLRSLETKKIIKEVESAENKDQLKDSFKRLIDKRG